MACGVDLDGRTKECVVADVYRGNIEHHTIEIKENPFAEVDVYAVVAIKRWLHPDAIATAAKQLVQDLPAPLYFRFAGGV